MRTTIMIFVALLLGGCGGIVNRELPRGDDAAPTPVVAPVDATAAVDSAPEPASPLAPVDAGSPSVDVPTPIVDAGSPPVDVTTAAIVDAAFDAGLDGPVDAGTDAPVGVGCCSRLPNFVNWVSPEAAAAAALPWYACPVGTLTSAELDGQVICGQ